MSTTTKCDKQTKDRGAICGTSGPPRVNYYRGMLLDEKDLSAEQTYQDSRRRRLASLMHGCGILCGLKLRDPEVYCGQLTFVIEAGVALDQDGHLLEVEHEKRIALVDICNAPDEGRCGCDDKPKPGTATPVEYCVVLKRRATASDPRPVEVPQGEKCGRPHEPSRMNDGWCIEFVALKPGDERCPVVPRCERVDKAPDLCAELETLFDDTSDAKGCTCSTCCDVVLGLITVDCAKGTLVVDREKQVRRYAWTAKRLDKLVAIFCRAACRPVPVKDGGPKPRGGRAADSAADKNADTATKPGG